MANRVIFILIICVCICCSSFSVCAVQNNIDFAKWNENPVSHIITTDDIHSNSALKNAVLKVEDDTASSRLIILFMLEFNPFTDINNVSIIMDINGGEKIIIHTGKDAEYNKDKYFVSSVINVFEESGIVYIETTLGIKEGLPENQTLTLQFSDTEGVLSNRYTVDISGGEFEDLTDTAEEQTSASTSKKKPTDKTKKLSKTDKADKTTAKTTTTESVLTTEDLVTTGYTGNDNSHTTLSTGKVVGGVTGVVVLILSAGYGLSHLIKSKQQKRGEG